jgi:hypothetical protein
MPLDPSAHYELGLVAIPAPGGSLAKAVISSALFSTSAYATPDALVDALMVGPIGDVELRDVSVPALAGVTGSGDAAFERLLVAAKLDPWPAVVGTRISRLWIRDAAGDPWRIAGVLLEASEPLNRPDRLDGWSLAGAGGTFGPPIVDSLGTRVAFVATPGPFEPAAGDLAVSATAHEPWMGAGARPISRSQAIAIAPAWSEELMP